MLAAYEYTDSLSGLKYRILSVEDMTCALIGVESKDISGELIIPSTSSYAGHDFTVVRLADGCLDFCKKITSVTIPSSVEVLGFGCFQGCSSIEFVSLSNNLKKIGGFCFSGCSMLKSISIPSGIKELDYSAFTYCDSLKRVIIEDAEVNYEPVFIECTDFTNTLFKYAEELYLGRQIGFIRYGSGWGIEAPMLKTLILGKEVDSWTKESNYYHREYFSFDRFKSLEKLVSQALIPPSIPRATDEQYMNLMVSVPEESLELYKKADVWKSFWNLQGYSKVDELQVQSKEDRAFIVYNLQGMRIKVTNQDDLQKLKSGVYIINGKKTLLK